MDQLIEFDGILVPLIFVLCLGCFIRFAIKLRDHKRERGIAITHFGYIIVLSAIAGRLVCVRLIMAGYYVSEIYLWITLTIGIALIIIGLMIKLIRIMKSDIKEIVEAQRNNGSCFHR